MNIYGVIAADVIASKRTQQYSNIDILNHKASSVSAKLRGLNIDLFKEIYEIEQLADEINSIKESMNSIEKVIELNCYKIARLKARTGL